MKVLTVLGTRPQFIKSAPVSRALKQANLHEVRVDTGQHYDPNMREIFAEQLRLESPAYDLAIGSGSHAYQTGACMQRLEPIIHAEQPDVVLVYGDTNAALCGALTASKMNCPVAHVEAGLRSFNRQMPEEVNRVVIDHLATWCFAPTQTAVDNLRQEAINSGVYLTGDVMLDATQQHLHLARQRGQAWIKQQGLAPGDYYLLTLHRAETDANPQAVAEMLGYLERQARPVLFPVHPRMRGLIAALGPFQNIRCTEPVGYLEMLAAIDSATATLTDSGGLQKESAFLGVPCVTLRNETEWAETVMTGWNQLVGLSVTALQEALENMTRPSTTMTPLFGDGQASHTMVQHLLGHPSARLTAMPTPLPQRLSR
jgi:UDP-GlcNAc3NAcA epimerase